MKKDSLFIWIAASALGLGVGFVALLQTGMFFEYGFDTDMHWQFVPPGQTLSAFAGTLVGLLIMGLSFGSAQALVVHSRLQRVVPWLVATAGGFGLMVVVMWPLQAMDVLGRIPGPVEPILATVGSGILAGILQYVVLRRHRVVASKWLALWIVGLLASLVPTAILFISLEGLGVTISWPVEVFLTGLMVAGVAAWISGKALFAALPEARVKI
jgi:hypothetical protein